jgi:hypothetical protein
MLERHPRLTPTEACEEVADKYGKNSRTLLNYYIAHKDVPLISLRSHDSSALTVEQEHFLLGYIASQNESHVDFRSSDVIAWASEMCGVPLRKRWFLSFKKKYRDVFMGSNRKKLEKARKSNTVTKCVGLFVKRFSEILRDLNLENKPAHVINADESLIYLRDSDLVWERYLIRGNTGQPPSERPDCIGSVLPFVAADGSVYVAVLCLKGKDGSRSPEIYIPNVNIQASRSGNSPLRWIIVTSPSGLITPQIFNFALKILTEIFHDIGLSNSRKVLLLDNLQLHQNLSDLQKLQQEFVTVVFFPPNASHFMQPLDDLVFAQFKQSLKKHYLSFRNKAQLVKQNYAVEKKGLAAVFMDAWPEGFTQEIIQKSWNRTGVFPLNSARINWRAKGNENRNAIPDASPGLTENVEFFRRKLIETRNEVADKFGTVQTMKPRNMRQGKGYRYLIDGEVTGDDVVERINRIAPLEEKANGERKGKKNKNRKNALTPVRKRAKTSQTQPTTSPVATTSLLRDAWNALRNVF